jgi:peptidoglycan/xylan/chitin deacetylase (PgdA/CDA1 family)
MPSVYRSRSRRRIRRLAVLAAVSVVLGVADAAAGNPALALLTGTGDAMGELIGSGGEGAHLAGPTPSPTRSRTPAHPSATPAPPPAPVPDPGTQPAPVPDPGTQPAPVSDPGTPPRPLIVSVAAGRVALTVDDGPDPRWTPELLDLLRARGVHATFCVVGEQVRAHPDLVRRIVAEGHTLCDHTETHDKHLPRRSRATIEREVRSAYDDIVAVSGGVRPALFRAPGGNWSPAVIAEAAKLGMRPLDWSVDPRDWSRPGTAAIAAVVSAAPSGSIVLVHDGGGDRSQTIAALRTAIPALQARGLQFVTL